MTICSTGKFDRKELIRWCYRILLEREPETDDVVKAFESSNFSSLHELKEMFFSSQEYKEKYKPSGVSGCPETGSVMTVAIPPEPPDRRDISIDSFEDLDQFVSNFFSNNCGGLSSKDFLDRHVLNYELFIQMFGQPMPDASPFSPAYTEWVHSFFAFISGRPYDFTNEGMSFNEFDSSIHPLAALPLDETISKIKAQVDFLTLLRPEKGQRILEMGCGLGSMAAMFELCGCDYNAVEASKTSVEVTRKRLFSDKLKNQVYHNHFYSISEMPGLFDLILFEASFHHCRDAGQMLKILHEKLAWGGRIIFLHEPVAEQYAWPWGLNITGEGLLQIRGRGWFELVFRDDYFLELLSRNNWMVQRRLTLSNSSALIEVIRK